MSEHVFLVALSFDHPGPRTEAERSLHRALSGIPRWWPGAQWWVAEDLRNDGSDCDSAVFCNPGSQPEAHALLKAHGLTQGHNRPATRATS